MVWLAHTVSEVTFEQIFGSSVQVVECGFAGQPLLIGGHVFPQHMSKSLVRSSVWYKQSTPVLFHMLLALS